MGFKNHVKTKKTPDRGKSYQKPRENSKKKLPQSPWGISSKPPDMGSAVFSRCWQLLPILFCKIFKYLKLCPTFKLNKLSLCTSLKLSSVTSVIYVFLRQI